MWSLAASVGLVVGGQDATKNICVSSATPEGSAPQMYWLREAAEDSRNLIQSGQADPASATLLEVCLDADPLTVSRGPGRHHGRAERALDVATPAPVATPTPLPDVPPARVLSSAETPTEALICSRPWSCETALSIAYCESRYRADAVGDGSYGIFQLQASVWAPVFVDFWQSWMDPEWNVAHAWIIYERAGGFWPWSCH